MRAGRLDLVWSEESWWSEVERTALDLGPTCGRVLIESVDSTRGHPAVMGAVDFAIKGWAGWITAGVLTVEDFLKLGAYGEALFAGSDAVWFLRTVGPRANAPEFFSDSATFREKGKPSTADASAVEWKEVELWMSRNGALAGVISGGPYVLTVRLIE